MSERVLHCAFRKGIVTGENMIITLLSQARKDRKNKETRTLWQRDTCVPRYIQVRGRILKFESSSCKLHYKVIMAHPPECFEAF